MSGLLVAEFVVPGRPIAKQRPRMGKAGRMYTPMRTKKYEADVSEAAWAAGLKMRDDRAYRFELNVGKTQVGMKIYDLGQLKKSMIGDLDNYCKSLIDGVNMFDGWDDRQMVELVARKYWEEECECS
jgi:Holliday junction resolvase RusA-like endonuclease